MVYSTVFMPYEVGDYSIYVHENLEGILQVGIIAEKPQDNPIYTYWTKEIVASPEGSILYFNEKLENIEAGHIYRGWTSKNDYKRTLEDIIQELYESGLLSLDSMLRLKGPFIHDM